MVAAKSRVVGVEREEMIDFDASDSHCELNGHFRQRVRLLRQEVFVEQHILRLHHMYKRRRWVGIEWIWERLAQYSTNHGIPVLLVKLQVIDISGLSPDRKGMPEEFVV